MSDKTTTPASKPAAEPTEKPAGAFPHHLPNDLDSVTDCIVQTAESKPMATAGAPTALRGDLRQGVRQVAEGLKAAGMPWVTILVYGAKILAALRDNGWDFKAAIKEILADWSGQ